MKRIFPTGTMIAAVAATWLFAAPNAKSAELLMIEEDGCYWCEAWNSDVAGIYPKTTEGQAAPLRRADIKTNLEAEFALKQAVLFTPTFLLVEDGKEVGRIEGYPGEDFFWGLLGSMLEKLTPEAEQVSEPAG